MFARPQQGAAPSWRPAISADGRYVAFGSASHNLSDEDRDDFLGPDDDFEDGLNVYVRDRVEHTTTLVSRATGPAGDAIDATAMVGSTMFSIEDDYKPVLGISPDGLHVAFATAATNLSAVDSDATVDVFMRDLPAAPLLISGSSLKLTDPPSGARRIKLMSKDARLATSSELLSAGATLRLIGNGFDVPYALPASSWRNARGKQVYYDKLLTGPVRKAEVRVGYLKLDGVGSQLGFSLGRTPIRSTSSSGSGTRATAWPSAVTSPTRGRRRTARVRRPRRSRVPTDRGAAAQSAASIVGTSM